MSTVLEQDRFYSVFLVSLATVLTNSQNRDDEQLRALGKKVYPAADYQRCGVDDTENFT